MDTLKKPDALREQHSWADCWRIVEEVQRGSPASAKILQFMLSFGCGQAEIKDLRGEHVTPDHVLFKRRKTQRVYKVPVYPHAKAQIEGLLNSGKCQRGKPVFQWRDPEQAFRGASKRLGLPVFELRSLRRAFILHCIEQGVEYRVVASWVGHRDARLVLSTYGTHISKTHEQTQVRKLEDA